MKEQDRKEFKKMSKISLKVYAVLVVIALILLMCSCTSEPVEEEVKEQKECSCYTVLRSYIYSLPNAVGSAEAFSLWSNMTIEGNCDGVQYQRTVKGNYKVGSQYCGY